MKPLFLLVACVLFCHAAPAQMRPAPPKAFDYVDPNAQLLVDKSIRAYAALRSLDMTFAWFNEDVMTTRVRYQRPNRLNVQTNRRMDRLVRDGFTWHGNDQGFYWPSASKSGPVEARDLQLSSQPVSDWLGPIFARNNILRGDNWNYRGPNRWRRVMRLRPQTLFPGAALSKSRSRVGVLCDGLSQELWNFNPRTRYWQYERQSVFFRRSDGLFWALRSVSRNANTKGKAYETEDDIANVTDLKVNPPLGDADFTYSLAQGQHDWVKDRTSLFWSPALEVGRMAPAFSWRDVNGKTQSLKNSANRVTVLLFDVLRYGEGDLAAWRAVHQKWGSQSATVLGFLLNASDQPAARFGAFPFSVARAQNDFDDDAVKMFGLKRVPFALVIGRDGRVAAINPQGAQLDAAIETALETPLAAPAPPSIESAEIVAARLRFEQTAKEIQFLDISAFLYNRWNLLWGAADYAAAQSSQAKLRAIVGGTEADATLVALTKHPDAKVRTLALAALFDRENPHLLPHIYELAGDKAPTFPGHSALSKSWLAMTGIGPPTESQTVGDIAGKMLGFYMSAAGYSYGFGESDDKRGFLTYWAPRKNRAWCASWFQAQLARATQGTSPLPKEAEPKVRALRQRIDALPGAERYWILLLLGNQESGNFNAAFATQSELVAAAKKLGPDALLKLLQRRPISDDPDLAPHNSEWTYEAMAKWILGNARVLLRPDQAPALLACEKREFNNSRLHIGDPWIWPDWAIAAAELRPAMARPVLHATLQNFRGEYDGEERTALVSALWRLGGSPEQAFVLNWFFSEKRDTSSGSTSQGDFFTSLQSAPSAPSRRLLAAIVADSRLEKAPTDTLRPLAELVNFWMKRPVFDPQTLWPSQPAEQKQLAAHIIGETRRLQKSWIKP